MSYSPVTVARLRRIRTGFPILLDLSSRPPSVNKTMVVSLRILWIFLVVNRLHI